MYSQYSLKPWWCHEADEYANVYVTYLEKYTWTAEQRWNCFIAHYFSGGGNGGRRDVVAGCSYICSGLLV